MGSPDFDQRRIKARTIGVPECRKHGFTFFSKLAEDVIYGIRRLGLGDIRPAVHRLERSGAHDHVDLRRLLLTQQCSQVTEGGRLEDLINLPIEHCDRLMPLDHFGGCRLAGWSRGGALAVLAKRNPTALQR